MEGLIIPDEQLVVGQRVIIFCGSKRIADAKIKRLDVRNGEIGLVTWKSHTTLLTLPTGSKGFALSKNAAERPRFLEKQNARRGAARILLWF